MPKSYSDLRGRDKLALAARVISDNGGTLRVEFTPPPGFREESSKIAAAVIAKWKYLKSQGYDLKKDIY